MIPRVSGGAKRNEALRYVDRFCLRRRYRYDYDDDDVDNGDDDIDGAGVTIQPGLLISRQWPIGSLCSVVR